MSKTTRRLGRGLDSLISQPVVPEETPHARPAGTAESEQRPPADPPANRGPMRVSVTALEPNPFQPREQVDPESVRRLADSIRRNGMLQPVVVRKKGDKYQIVAGERRWRAALECAAAEIPVNVVHADDEQMLELALIENLQREDLNPIERARAYRQFADRFGLTPDDIGQRVGEDRTTVTNYLRLLDLSGEIQQLLAAGRISTGHARCLLGLPDESRRLELARSAANNDLSVRALEQIVRHERSQPRRPPAQPIPEKLRSAHVRDLERRFEEAVRTKVSINEGKKKGAGRIVIHYYSLDDFDRIAAQLGVPVE